MNDMGKQLRHLSQRLRERHADVPVEITDKLETILRRFDEGGDNETDQEDTWEIPSRLSLEHELHNLGNDIYKLLWYDEAIEFYNLCAQC